jgi:ferric-dicitrate binding protein FerR (iron transport regulator)
VKSYDNGMTPPASGWKPSGTIATRTAPAAPPPVGPPSVTPARLPSAPRERKPALAALALLLVVVGVLAAVYLQIQARNEVGVIQISKEVAQGQQITPADVSEVMVAQNSGINYVLWSQSSLLTKYSAAAAGN